ncbi:RtcB family protein [Sandaracinus amylolyticus]|uniref:3'-phosphate/5'-hydroxy nucleic acid ligase n=1 Tax=Sandaracinus amylolyticus TaxID=927083 RepID=A0A0F6W597_9BACT|nr:RtcB family protein [Sandaracinus amylolyticus]AKF07831.1 RNA-2',3'-PO4 RNA-5'-OH ligase [Sandaracinus amylolyticus]
MTLAPIAIWSAGPLAADVRRFLERAARAPDVVRIAVMPDVHLAGDACVGTAIATRRTLRPELLGSDLGCGVAAMSLGTSAERVRDPRIAARVLADLSRAVPTHRGPTRALEGPPLSTSALERIRARDGAVQLGTLGRGNHFVELQEDEADGALWLMVHSGSRALGPAIQEAHVARAPRDLERFACLDADSDEGRAYLHDLDVALAYARASRRIIADRVAEIVATHTHATPDSASWIECHHDAVARETHDGEPLWVHRKGAVPAHEGAPVLVPGSMGTSSHHAEGRGHAPALASSAHGAGRALTRGEARRRVSARELARQMDGVAYDTRMAAQLVEEAPSAYHDVKRVMRAQRELVRVLRTMRPVLVHKGA